MTKPQLMTILSAVLCVTACKAKNETTVPVAANEPAATPATAPEDDGSLADVSIDPELAKLCGISAPKFGFNSSSVGKEAQQTLDALVACFVAGPAKDRRLAIVGHADPRGTEEYNFNLGQKRAGNIEAYVHEKGLEAARTESSSRGELDASGSDEEGWRTDRRVDLLLAK